MTGLDFYINQNFSSYVYAMKGLRLCYILLLVALGVGAWAQTREADSLVLLLKTSREDTAKVKLLNSISREYRLIGNYNKGLPYAQQAMTLAQKLNFKKGQVTASNNIGMMNYGLGNASEALKYLFLSLKMCREMKLNEGAAAAYNNIGLTYYSLANYPEALKNYFAALKINETTGNRSWMANNYNNIGLIYTEQRNYAGALKSYSEAFKLYKLADDKDEMAHYYNNTGNVYMYQGNYAKALESYFNALKIYEETEYKEGLASTYNNIGAVYKEEGLYAKALEQYLKSLQLNEETGEKNAHAATLLNIGELYIHLHKPTEARSYLNRSLKLSQETGSKDGMRDVYENLAGLDSSVGNYKAAFRNYQLYIIYKDSIDNEEVKKKSMQSIMQYEFDKKEMAARAVQDKKDALTNEQYKIKELQLSRSRYITLALVAVLLLSAATGFIFFRQNRLRSQQRTLQLEQKLLRSQMNPHFIFNSLQAIQNYILKHEEKEAVKYLSSFANITRSVLENSRMEEISLKKEISLLENYLHLQKLRFGNRFDYTINTDPNIDTENTFIPPMLSQPFIENALEHGMRDIESGGKIEISFTLAGSSLLFEIIDNGRGMPVSDTPVKQHQSLALAITKERVELMNKKSARKTIFSITDAFPLEAERKGVKVQFSIPL